MADGTNGDVISLYPPLTFSRENITEMGALLRKTFDEAGNHLEGGG